MTAKRREARKVALILEVLELDQSRQESTNSDFKLNYSKIFRGNFDQFRLKLEKDRSKTFSHLSIFCYFESQTWKASKKFILLGEKCISSCSKASSVSFERVSS